MTRRRFRSETWAAAIALTIALSAGVRLGNAQTRADRDLHHFVTDETGRSLEVRQHLSRVISLAPSITETLYALGLGNRIVADTDYCDYPAEAARKPHVGTVQSPSIERIVSLKPDLVLGSAEGNRREIIDQLTRVGIPIYGVSAHSLDDLLKSIRDLGSLFGDTSRAEALDSGLESRIRAVAARVEGQPKPRVLFVTWYQPLITIGRPSFVADVVRRAGGVSISDDLTEEWPRLSLEAVLERRPDVVLMPRSQTYSPSPEELKRLPGWRDMDAVRSGRVYWVPDTIVRPCPRLVDALEEVARILHPSLRPSVPGEPSKGGPASR